MTTFEEMQQSWQAQNAKFEEITLISQHLLRQDRIRRIETPISALRRSLGFEAAFSALGMLILGNFIAGHWTELRFLWPAALLDLWVCATLIATIAQLVAASRVDYDGPLIKVQEQLTHLRILRLRAFRWMFLTGQIVWWIPFGIIALKMLAGVDAYRYVSPTFLALNLFAGLVAVPVALLTASRMRVAGQGAWYERLSDVIAGRSLSEAQRQARALADFR